MSANIANGGKSSFHFARPCGCSRRLQIAAKVFPQRLPEAMRMSANITNSSKSGFPQIRQAMRMSVNITNSIKSDFPTASQSDAHEREYCK
jgi:hypothetical protein